MSILHVLMAMDSGQKILVSEESLLQAKGLEGLDELTDLGFAPLLQVTIFDKLLQNPRKGYVLRKGDFDTWAWVRNPRKFLNLLDFGETMFFTEGLPDVNAYGKGLVTTMVRGGSNVSRITHIIVVNVEGHPPHFAFKAFETRELRGDER